MSPKEGRENYVKVAVRCRPISEKELSDGYQSIVEFDGDNKIIIRNINTSPSEKLGTKSGERQNYAQTFEFDSVFNCDSKQKEVYEKACRPIVESALSGYNGTIFTYGQTGTGKTYTIEGPASSTSTTRRSSSGNGTSSKVHEQSGIIPRTFEHIFTHVSKNPNTKFLVRASYLEIYQEEIHDLLKKDKSIKLEIHERPDSGFYIKDLTSFVCKSISEIERVMKVGNQNRKVGATDMNEHSSRSHAIFMITIEQQENITPTETNKKANELLKLSSSIKKDDNQVIKVSKLNLVDLAGSERQRKTNSSGQRQRESIKINLSLSALGNVINSLMKLQQTYQQKQGSMLVTTSGEEQATFIPYRDSKLTRLLQDSLGGNSKTLMIANIGPASYNYEETISTLNYASKTKCIKNCPRLNEDPKDTLLKQLQKEIGNLRSKLALLGEGNKHGQPKSTVINGKNVSADKLNSSDQDDSEHVEKELLAIKEKLASLEGKLLNGSDTKTNSDGNISLDVDILQGYTNEQAIELEKSRTKLAKQIDRERVIREELEKHEEVEMLAKESYNTVQQEVEAKKRLIRQVLVKIKTLKDDIERNQEAYRLELDELDQLQGVLQKELKLKCLIMDNFIPNEHVDQLLPRIVYNEKKNICTVLPLNLPIDSCTLNDTKYTSNFNDLWQSFDAHSIRPRSEFERLNETICPSNIRHKYENIIESKLEKIDQFESIKELELDQSEFKLNETSSDSIKIQNLIDQALNEREPDIVI